MRGETLPKNSYKKIIGNPLGPSVELDFSSLIVSTTSSNVKGLSNKAFYSSENPPLGPHVSTARCTVGTGSLPKSFL
jgi:hypothetical protein